MGECKTDPIPHLTGRIVKKYHHQETGSGREAMKTEYTITLAQPEHLNDLPQIEQQAASVFRGWNVPDSVIGDTTPLEEFQAAQAAGLLVDIIRSPHDDLSRG